MLKNVGSKISTISENSSNRKVLEEEREEKLQLYMYLLQLSELKALATSFFVTSCLIRNLGPAALLRCGKM